MDLLSLIIVFLALAVCGSIAYIAWELTSERPPRPGDDRASGTESRRERRDGNDER